MRTIVVLPGGEPVTFHGLHPRPLHPGHSSAPGDIELVMAAREIARTKEPTVVAGDLRDVASSRTNRLFQNLSGLLDPRQGRGLFAMFHAQYPFARWPLDHIFFSEHFLLANMERPDNVG